MDFLYLFGNCFCVHVPVAPLVMVAVFLYLWVFVLVLQRFPYNEVAICIFDYIPL